MPCVFMRGQVFFFVRSRGAKTYIKLWHIKLSWNQCIERHIYHHDVALRSLAAFILIPVTPGPLPSHGLTFQHHWGAHWHYCSQFESYEFSICLGQTSFPVSFGYCVDTAIGTLTSGGVGWLNGCNQCGNYCETCQLNAGRGEGFFLTEMWCWCMLVHLEKDVYFSKLFSQPQCSGSHEVPAGVNMGKLEFVFFSMILFHWADDPCWWW